jgi:hypothetical protein
MSVYLGRPGELVQIRSPRAGVKAALSRQSAARITLGGGRIVDFAPGILREWTFDYANLTRDEHYAIRAFYAGHNGHGPWCLIDSSDRNLLTENQSSATSSDYSTDGFTTTFGMLSSIAAMDSRGPRLLAVDIANAPNLVLTIDGPNSAWPGVPAVAGMPYQWSCLCSGFGEAMATVTAQISWMDIDGTILSTFTGTSITTTGTNVPDLTLVKVAAHAPVGTAYVSPRLAIDPTVGGAYLGGSMIVGGGGLDSMILVDEPQLSMIEPIDDLFFVLGCAWITGGPAVLDCGDVTGIALPDPAEICLTAIRDVSDVWTPGLGIPRVSIPALENSLFRIDRHDNSVTFAEVK